ncbi:MAG TPA: O-antigen ligase family protein [bacterium]|nr:O-antigen ligase family protein [bacterium]
MYRANPYTAREQSRALGLSALIFFLYFLIAIKTEFLLSFAILTGFVIAVGLFWLMVENPGYGVAVMIIGTALDQMGKIPGTPITIFHLGFAVSMAAWLLLALMGKSGDFRRTAIDLPLLLFLAMISFSLLYTPDRADATVNFLRLLALVLVMYVTTNVVRDRRTLAFALASLILSALALSAFALTSIGGTSTSMMQLAVGFAKVFGRFGATFENPNYFATFLMLALALAFAYIIYGGVPGLIRLILLPVSVVMLIAMIGTFSRAAWVAMIAAAAVVIYYSRYRRLIFITAIAMVIIAIPLLWNSVFFQSFFMRFTSLSDASADPSSMTRVFLFRGGWNMLLDSYFLGIGYRGFPVYYEQTYKPHSQVLYDVFESHTLPMEILAELGIIGFSLFIWLLVRYFRYAITTMNSLSTPFLKASYIGVFAALVGYFANALFSPGQLSGNFLWIGFGLTFAIPRLERSTDPRA